MSEPLKITDPDNVPVKFVSLVGGAGFLNGVINLTLLTTRWTPDTLPQDQVPPDLVVCSRLRFDLAVAQELRDVLNKQIEENTKPNTKAH
jgi:hypothetical protein